MKLIYRALIGAVLCATAATSAFAAEGKQADATIEFKATSVNVGFGGVSGEGTLTWQGNKIPFTIKGLNFGRVGVSSLEAKGEVYNLKNVEDFNERFSARAAGATVGIGGGVATMTNPKGVEISASATSKGIDLGLALSDPHFTLDAEVLAQVMAKTKKTEYVGEKISDSVKALAKVCGCPVYMNVAWSTYKADPASNKRRVAYAMDEFVSAASGHCADLTKREDFCKNIAQVDVAFDDKSVSTVGRSGNQLNIVMNERGELTPSQIAEALIK